MRVVVSPVLVEGYFRNAKHKLTLCPVRLSPMSQHNLRGPLSFETQSLLLAVLSEAACSRASTKDRNTSSRPSYTCESTEVSLGLDEVSSLGLTGQEFYERVPPQLEGTAYFADGVVSPLQLQISTHPEVPTQLLSEVAEADSGFSSTELEDACAGNIKGQVSISMQTENGLLAERFDSSVTLWKDVASGARRSCSRMDVRLFNTRMESHSTTVINVKNCAISPVVPWRETGQPRWRVAQRLRGRSTTPCSPLRGASCVRHCDHEEGRHDGQIGAQSW